MKSKRRKKISQKDKNARFVEKYLKVLNTFIHEPNNGKIQSSLERTFTQSRYYHVLLNVISFLYSIDDISISSFCKILEMTTDLDNLETVRLIEELKKFNKYDLIKSARFFKP